MKTPQFWYKGDSLMSRLLAPLGQLYRYGGMFRRYFSTSYRSALPILCLGNITAGGAGKTPSCLALYALLKSLFPEARPVFVTRGYGGRVRGPARVDPSLHSALDVGDEALLLARKAPCWVGRDRVAAIKAAEQDATHIIVDDGLQNPHFAPSLSFLVIDGPSGFGNGRLIPAGPLRETLADALPRLDAVFMIGPDKNNITGPLGVPVFTLMPHPVLPQGLKKGAPVLAFCGIAHPKKFYDSCAKLELDLHSTRDFPDHHPFSNNDLISLEETARRHNLLLVTTEKDSVRLPPAFRNKVHIVGLTLEPEGSSLGNFLREALRKAPNL